MPLSEADKESDRVYNQGQRAGHIQGISRGLEAGDHRTCKTLWETFNDFVEDGIQNSGYGDYPSHILDDLKDKLTEVLPYGPDEVY